MVSAGIERAELQIPSPFVSGWKPGQTGTAAVANSLVWGKNVTGGDLLVIGVENNTTQTGTISTVTDSVGTVYKTTVLAATGHGVTIGLVWGIAGGSGANTTSITWNSGTAGAMVYAEFTGAPPNVQQDGLTSVIAASSATVNTPVVTTTLPGDLVLNFVGTSEVLTVVAPWVLIGQVNFTMALAYQANVLPNSYTPNMTQTSAIYYAISLGLGALYSTSTPTHRLPEGV